MFSEKDLNQIKAKGIELSQITQQINNFKVGFPFLKVEKAATVGDGIVRLDGSQHEQLIQYYDQQSSSLRVCKFVPASGAASRMFKALFAFMKSYTGSAADVAQFNADQGFNSPYTFFSRLQDFAFYDDLVATLKEQDTPIEALLAAKKYEKILAALLTAEGMNYGALPKALLKFHRYAVESRTPIAEHLIEGANYGKNDKGEVQLHFTVSPHHRSRFLAKIAAIQGDYEARFGVQFIIELSEQQPYTDTIGVNLDNTPFRLEDGRILFRPGGHGALIENLNALDADIVFIKNIDNVVPDSLKPITYQYKKLIGSVLLFHQQQIFSYLGQLEENASEALVRKITQYYETELATIFPESFHQQSWTEKSEFLKAKLNRPTRVAGMVKNEGEPGGGPFWAANSDGTISLQIVESSQIDKNRPQQKTIVETASHFNPVDLVCGLKNHKGEKFDLLNYRDPQTGFIAFKSKNGKDLKAQELPGLWNGAMSDWNTIFVEVPIETFNPVKRVNDLLRKEHQV